ncbi:bifunctional diaminohydroxyphosphoribosylaminopyrimidine deaminase/5-amino-6-(5-phosphoribosylamino)uracil reductase RibD [bacterium]|nr:bifunctional diaminohydroxyphosphoribosylaminopyrimidine deaminase/5-amino-6-(5-phosphoribosylamino)uracil reductase RibD [bacterium]
MASELDIEALMRRALRLARKGEGFVHPNPLVGAVLVKNGRVIGEGCHMEVGKPHAEINAMSAAREAGHEIHGGSMFVTLEPCAHFGRTPPCVEALVEAGIAEVYVGMIDPNPRVSGRGLAYLRENRIRVTERILEGECAAINEAFTKYITVRRPYVTVKAAMTLDGKIATRTGKSRWISSPESLRFAHHLRHVNQAIMVGAGSVRQDDPRLTCRLPRGRVSHPIRLIVDGKLSIPEDAKVIAGDLPAKTIVITTNASDPDKRKRIEDRGNEVLVIEGGSNFHREACPERSRRGAKEAKDAQDDGNFHRKDAKDAKGGQDDKTIHRKDAKSAKDGHEAAGHIDLDRLMDTLGEMRIASLMIEGGSTLLSGALSAGIVDKLFLVVAPKIFGGANAPSVIGGEGVDDVDDALIVDDLKVTHLGVDLLIEGRPRRRLGG